MMSKLFWGVVIVLFGLSLIINAIFKLNIPFFKILLAIVIIFFGLKLLFGSFGVERGHDVVFSDQKVKIDRIDDDQEFNSIFSSQTIDLRDVTSVEENRDIEVNAIFGSAKVYIPKDVNVRIKSSSAFGSVRTPDGNQVSFGEGRFNNQSSDSAKTLYIEANAVFGSVDIRN